VALAAIKGEKTLIELAQEFDVGYYCPTPAKVKSPYFSGQHWWSWLITAGAIGADIFTAGAATGFTMATLESVGEGIGENLAIGVASNAIQTGHLGINEGDLEGAAIGGALDNLEAKIPMPGSTLAKAPIHYAENAFNSLVENGVVNGHAKVDWIGAGISTGIDMLNDYANARPCSTRDANAAGAVADAGGDQMNNGPAVGGHEEYPNNVTTAQLQWTGYKAFSILRHADGYHNTSLFMQPHFNVMSGGGYQVHFDIFNPAAGYVGLGLHGVVDLGIGSLFFKNSTVLDAGC
jgi:hypothetical protein